MTELEIRESREEKSRSFASGVLILTLSAVIVKIIGLVYKIPMLTLLGSEGMGYFNSAYEIYTLFGVVSTAGLPVAMSVMISSARSRGEGSVKRIFSVSMTLFLLLGIAGSALMLALAHPFSLLLKSDKTIYCIWAISPTVFFVCLSSVYRGFFQGLGKMTQTAISQVIEALLKLVLGLLFAFVALSYGFEVEIVAAFAVMGLTLGTVVSAIYLLISKRLCREGEIGGAAKSGAAEEKSPSTKKRAAEMSAVGEKGAAEMSAVGKKKGARRSTVSGEGVLRSLLRIAIPVTLSSAVISLTKIIDMAVILRRMQDVGFTNSEAFSSYGNYTTLALPLFSLAPALISSVALPLVPSLSSAVAAGDREGQTTVARDAIRLTMLVAMPISLGLCFFSREILTLLFSGQTEAIAESAPLLSTLALSVVLACLITVGNAILQAYSRAGLPIISMIAGSIFKVVLAYLMIGNSSIGLMGAPISTFFCDLVINALNFYFIGKYLPEQLSVSELMVKPFVSALVSIGAGRLIYALAERYFGGSTVLTLSSIALCAMLYLPISYAFGVVSREDVKSFLRRR